ncbi:MAG: hypothetical protein N3D73_01370 [Candidatus Diapherotrites archaeon]|nr:hypothetical protein [Candidatus Diapherotrites archaeon]
MNLQSEITNYGVFSVVYLDKSLDSIDYNTQTSIFINSTSPSTNNCKYYYFLSNQLLISSYPFSFLATDSNYESVISFKPIKPTIVSTNIINNPPIECDSYYEVYSDPYE